MAPEPIAAPHTARPVPAAALAAASARLAAAGIESAQLDAELLMAAAAGVARASLVGGAAQIGTAALARFEQMVARREAREPLAYIVGRREFFSLEFRVRPGVLIPRPETETVVEAALDFLRGRPAATVLDIGTGSGAIAIAIARNAPAGRIVASDISKVSLGIAADNARRHRCADRIAFLEGDCFAVLDGRHPPFDPFDLIVSNPPYVAAVELASLAPEVRDFEPRVALEGGLEGMDFYRRIAAGLSRWLARGGQVILEVGAGQAEMVEAMMLAAGCDESVRMRDLAGVERVVRARRAH
ncbi:MAG TPA: peptide chain release factor N(5)-glutamine methyltransferase [Candidatus Binataceae bacterium]|nr:peptide chain release factor N(5)-glutamine methyltransferase [Candidatus Binataceae bacterium]